MRSMRLQSSSRRPSLVPGRWRVPLIGALLGVLYVDWAVPFMLESSVVAIDGRRYFGLFDDAMISMRYAWNFSHGQGLVWNAGERIEGFTNLLWTLIMSVFTGLLDKVERGPGDAATGHADRAGVRPAGLEAGARGDGGLA